MLRYVEVIVRVMTQEEYEWQVGHERWEEENEELLELTEYEISEDDDTQGSLANEE